MEVKGHAYVVKKSGFERRNETIHEKSASWSAAHEAGHLLDLEDQYYNIGGLSVPKEGFENNLMAERSQSQLKESQIEQILTSPVNTATKVEEGGN